MQIELSEQDIANILEFLSRSPIKGAESFVMAILIQTFKVALQPAVTEETGSDPSNNGTEPKAEEEILEAE